MKVSRLKGVLLILVASAVIIVCMSILSGDKAFAGETGFRNVNPLEYGAPRGQTTRLYNAIPKYRKIGAYYFWKNDKGLFLSKTIKGRKSRVDKEGNVGWAVSDGKKVYYSVHDLDDYEGEVYKYDIQSEDSTIICNYGEDISFAACYGGNLFFNADVEDGSPYHSEIIKYNIKSGKSSVFKRNCYATHQYGKYVVVYRNDNMLNPNSILNLKKGQCKTICKKGIVVLSADKAYYFDYKTNKLRSCSFSGKNRKTLLKFRKGSTPQWMTDEKCGYYGKKGECVFTYKTKKTKKL